MDETSKVTIKDVKAAREKLGVFLNLRAHNAHLNDETGKWKERRTLEEVVSELPTFKGKNLEELASALPAGSVVLDYGCGDPAVALTQLYQKYGHLVCEGVTYPVFREWVPKHLGVRVFRKEGDHFLGDHKKRYNLIYSANAFMYSPDHFRTLKRAYGALAEGGVLLIDALFNAARPLLDEYGDPATAQQLQAVLHKNGYEVEVLPTAYDELITPGFSFAIKKTKRNLKLPIRLIRHPALTRPAGDNWDTPFMALGTHQPQKVTYIYQFMPGVE